MSKKSNAARRRDEAEEDSKKSKPFKQTDVSYGSLSIGEKRNWRMHLEKIFGKNW